MNTTTATPATTAPDYRQAATVAVVASVLLVGRLFLEGRHQVWSDVISVAVFAVIGLVVAFGLVVPRALRTPPSTVAWTGVAMAALSLVVLVFFFFSAAPFVFGYATWFLGRTAATRSVTGWRPITAQVVGLLVVAGDLAWAVYGLVSGWGPGLPH